MDKFAFIGHPTDFDLLYLLLGKWGKLAKKISKFRLKQLLEYIPPYKLFYIDSIQSKTGKKVSGYGIVCPLFPEQMVGKTKKKAINKIISAVKLAKKLGAKIVGLGGFTSIITDQGKDILKDIKDIAITTGNTCTASLALDGIFKAADELHIDLSSATVLVVGATGDIGRICSEVLGNKVNRLILNARDLGILNNFAELLRKLDCTAHIEIVKNIDTVTLQSDIILTATSSLLNIIKSHNVKPGAVVCDVSVPPNVAREMARERKDILIFEGGLAELPSSGKINNIFWKQLFPNNSIFGCLAETIILTMEKKFENFSIGRGNINLEKLNEIQQMKAKHGIKLAQFFCGDKLYTHNDMNIIRSK